MCLIRVARTSGELTDRQRRLPSCERKHALKSQNPIEGLRALAERGAAAPTQLSLADVEASRESADVSRRRTLRSRGNDGRHDRVPWAAASSALADCVLQCAHRATDRLCRGEALFERSR